MFDNEFVFLYLAVGAVAFCLLWFYWVFAAGRKLFASATNIFVLQQILFLIGTLLFVDMGSADDKLWLGIILGDMFCIFLGALVANFFFGFRPRKEIERFVSTPVTFDLQSNLYWVLIVSMGVLCLSVGIYFSQSVGYNVLLWAIRESLTGGSVDTSQYSYMRSSISNASEGYVAPGFALQFTAILMPVVICMAYFRARHTKKLVDYLFTLLLLLPDLYFLTITGGRGYLLRFFLALIFLFSLYGPLPTLWKSVRRGMWITIGSAMLFYTVSTVLMGRVSAVDGGILDVLGGVVSNLFNRVVGSVTAGDQLTIIRYFMSQPPTEAWGAEWWTSLVSIVDPSAKGYGIANQLHGLLFRGNESGRVGMLVWTSFWYNWGLLGSLFWALVTGFCLQGFTVWYVRGNRSLSRVIILFFAGFCLAQFRDPYSLFLNGFITITLFYGMTSLAKIIQSKTASEATVSQLPDVKLPDVGSGPKELQSSLIR